MPERLCQIEHFWFWLTTGDVLFLVIPLIEKKNGGQLPEDNIPFYQTAVLGWCKLYGNSFKSNKRWWPKGLAPTCFDQVTSGWRSSNGFRIGTMGPARFQLRHGACGLNENGRIKEEDTNFNQAGRCNIEGVGKFGISCHDWATIESLWSHIFVCHTSVLLLVSSQKVAQAQELRRGCQ